MPELVKQTAKDTAHINKVLDMQNKNTNESMTELKNELGGCKLEIKQLKEVLKEVLKAVLPTESKKVINMLDSINKRASISRNNNVSIEAANNSVITNLDLMATSQNRERSSSIRFQKK